MSVLDSRFMSLKNPLSLRLSKCLRNSGDGCHRGYVAPSEKAYDFMYIRDS